MSNKQSSVEWLAIELWERMIMKGDGAELNELLEQAKAMHKEEMIEFAHINSVSYRHEIAQKYNETYGGKELF